MTEQRVLIFSSFQRLHDKRYEAAFTTDGPCTETRANYTKNVKSTLL